MSNAKLEVQNLTLKYGDALAVDNVSFSNIFVLTQLSHH